MKDFIRKRTSKRVSKQQVLSSWYSERPTIEKILRRKTLTVRKWWSSVNSWSRALQHDVHVSTSESLRYDPDLMMSFHRGVTRSATMQSRWNSPALVTPAGADLGRCRDREMLPRQQPSSSKQIAQTSSCSGARSHALRSAALPPNVEPQARALACCAWFQKATPLLFDKIYTDQKSVSVGLVLHKYIYWNPQNYSTQARHKLIVAVCYKSDAKPKLLLYILSQLTLLRKGYTLSA